MLQMLSAIAFLLVLTHTFKPCEPFGPRIFYGAQIKDPSSTQKLQIYFNTASPCERSYAQLLINGKITKLQCSTTSLKLSPLTKNYETHIHKCRTDAISYGQVFYYNVFGLDDTEMTPIPYSNYIQTKIADPLNKTYGMKVIVLADWSKMQNNLSKYTPIDQLFMKTKKNENIDALIVIGDIGYDLDTNKCKNYEQFLIMLGNVAADMPIIMITGNHEYNTQDNWQLYVSSFELYGLDTDQIVSLDLGALRVVAFDPYGLLYGTKSLQSQDQLSQKFEASLQRSRNSGQFIIPISHYPLACSGTSKNCKSDRTLMKSYWDSMLANEVSLYIGAHYHTYQRLYPYIKGDKFTTQKQNYKSGEGYLLTIVEGVAGNDKDIVESIDKIQAFTAAYTINETGFAILQITMNNIRYRHLSTKQGQMDRVDIAWSSSVGKLDGSNLLEQK